MVATEQKMPEGWGWPGAARKAHYFVDGRSLCGRWGWIGGSLQPAGEPSSDDCAACARKLAKRLPVVEALREFKSHEEKVHQTYKDALALYGLRVTNLLNEFMRITKAADRTGPPPITATRADGQAILEHWAIEATSAK